MFRLFERAVPRVPAAWAQSVAQHHYRFAVGPLAGLGARESAPDPVFFLSGMAVMSAGLVVLRAAQRATAFRPAFAAAAPMRLSTAEEAITGGDLGAADREVLLGALAAAAETFYSIAGHLPRDASDRALGKADDLRELVWLNRAR